MSIRTKPVSVMISWAIAFIATTLLGGWLSYLSATSYWEWRNTELVTASPLEIDASIGICTITGAALAVCLLWSFYDRPVRRARRQQQLRLGLSRRQHRSRV